MTGVTEVGDGRLKFRVLCGKVGTTSLNPRRLPVAICENAKMTCSNP